ncbi:hypothetical protein LMG33818_001124 [Halomonadaceae bacterium LMG 33818]|uniref:DUF945 family protein n=1 Tax=Cernens ardua TaxID=3402176 RepID=UPI003EDBF89B
MISRVRKKGAIAACLAIVVVVLMSYLAALIYSRDVFARYLDRELHTLNQTTDIHWYRTAVSKGLFSSSLQVVGEFPAQSNFPLHKVTLPLVVHHGVFHTTVYGRVEPQWRSSRSGSSCDFATLFAHYPAPTFHASINQLTRTVHGEVQAADLHRTLAGNSITLDATGIHLPFSVKGDRVIYDIHWHSLQWGDGQRIYRAGAGHDYVDRTLASLLTTAKHGHSDQAYKVDASDFYQEKAEIGEITLTGFLPLPLLSHTISLQDLSFQGNASRKNGQLTYHVLASIRLAERGRSETNVEKKAGKTLGSLKLDETLDHIDMSALARLLSSVNAYSREPLNGPSSVSQQPDEVHDSGPLAPEVPSTNQALAQFLQRTWPDIQAILAGSPRLRINQLTLTTPFLDQPVTLSGLINIDGRSGVPTSYEAAHSDAGLAWWRQHLHGDLDVLHVPASLSALSGSEDNSDDINLVISHGELKVNGQRFFSLF